jgi:hypothetical protein
MHGRGDGGPWRRLQSRDGGLKDGRCLADDRHTIRSYKSKKTEMRGALGEAEEGSEEKTSIVSKHSSCSVVCKATAVLGLLFQFRRIVSEPEAISKLDSFLFLQTTWHLKPSETFRRKLYGYHDGAMQQEQQQRQPSKGDFDIK